MDHFLRIKKIKLNSVQGKICIKHITEINIDTFHFDSSGRAPISNITKEYVNATFRNLFTLIYLHWRVINVNITLSTVGELIIFPILSWKNSELNVIFICWKIEMLLSIILDFVTCSKITQNIFLPVVLETICSIV